MPIYEYRCCKCGERFELLVFPGDTPACKKCGAAEVEKLVSTCIARGENPTGSACSTCNATSCSTCRNAR